MHRVERTAKQDRNFTSTMLHLFYQSCYYILNTTEQLLKLKTWELFATVLKPRPCEK